eukprot:CAMPEP_0202953828 /NCGR_PEP_ID=MMETSP1395-20130829/48734_1 /ASSEMBLY_ACC=CAM_ASM_000871 /TAXON_ID=5961 /ORGANISM="Blepharisma japonicum, Strain Stock R1072" /LENGTH=32 /DNA_ID= /DNA_START= /DNA_END= /DNA_ORIENTATION=
MGREGFKGLLDAICSDEEVNEVMEMLEIKDRV